VCARGAIGRWAVRGTEEDNLRLLVDSVIAYIESDAYASAGIA
jgi:hypothetical protein